LIGTGLEELRIKSKPIFIKGTLADNRSDAISFVFQLSITVVTG